MERRGRWYHRRSCSLLFSVHPLSVTSEFMHYLMCHSIQTRDKNKCSLPKCDHTGWILLFSLSVNQCFTLFYLRLRNTWLCVSVCVCHPHSRGLWPHQWSQRPCWLFDIERETKILIKRPTTEETVEENVLWHVAIYNLPANPRCLCSRVVVCCFFIYLFCLLLWQNNNFASGW